MRQTFAQPALLFVLLLQLVLLLSLFTGLSLTYEDGQLAEIRLFSLRIEEPLFFLDSAFPSLTGLLFALVMFLLIAGTASLHTEYLSDPLLEVVIPRVRSRTAFLLSRVAGLWCAVLFDLGLFAGLCWSVISWKLGAPVSASLFSAIMLFFWQFMIISSYGVLFGLLTESTTGVAILGLSFHFLLGNAEGWIGGTAHPWWKPVIFLVPATHELDRAELRAVTGNPVEFLALTHVFVPVALCLGVSAALFRQREL